MTRGPAGGGTRGARVRVTKSARHTRISARPWALALAFVLGLAACGRPRGALAAGAAEEAEESPAPGAVLRHAEAPLRQPAPARQPGVQMDGPQGATRKVKSEPGPAGRPPRLAPQPTKTTSRAARMINELGRVTLASESAGEAPERSRDEPRPGPEGGGGGGGGSGGGARSNGTIGRLAKAGERAQQELAGRPARRARARRQAGQGGNNNNSELLLLLKCRVEKDLYLDFDEYQHYTCANCYNQVPREYFHKKFGLVRLDKRTVRLIEPDGADGNGPRAFIWTNDTARIQRTFRNPQKFEKWRTCCRQAVECCRENFKYLAQTSTEAEVQVEPERDADDGPDDDDGGGGPIEENELAARRPHGPRPRRRLVDDPRREECPGTWDGLSCWAPSAAGRLAWRECPSVAYLLDFEPACRGYVSKQCFQNASWFINRAGHEWSDYSTCSPEGLYKARMLHASVAYVCEALIVAPALLIIGKFPNRGGNKRIRIMKSLLLYILLNSLIQALQRGFLAAGYFAEFRGGPSRPGPPASYPAQSLPPLLASSSSSSPMSPMFPVPSPSPSPSPSRSQQQQPSPAYSLAEPAPGQGFDKFAPISSRFGADSLAHNSTTVGPATQAGRHARSIGERADEDRLVARIFLTGRARSAAPDGQWRERPFRADPQLAARGNNTRDDDDRDAHDEFIEPADRQAGQAPPLGPSPSPAPGSSGATRANNNAARRLVRASAAAEPNSTSSARAADPEPSARPKREDLTAGLSVQSAAGAPPTQTPPPPIPMPQRVKRRESAWKSLLCWLLQMAGRLVRLMSYAWMFTGGVYLCSALHFAPAEPPANFIRVVFILTNAFPILIFIAYVTARTLNEPSPLNIALKAPFLWLRGDTGQLEQLVASQQVCWFQESKSQRIEDIADWPNLVLVCSNAILFLFTLFMLFRINRPGSTRPDTSPFAYFKAAGTLLFLYGGHYFLLAYRPASRNCSIDTLMFYVFIGIDILQGIAISIVFCYMTQEGGAVIAKYWRNRNRFTPFRQCLWLSCASDKGQLADNGYHHTPHHSSSYSSGNGTGTGNHDGDHQRHEANKNRPLNHSMRSNTSACNGQTDNVTELVNLNDMQGHF